LPTIKTQDQDSARALSTSLSADGGTAGLAVMGSGGDVDGRSAVGPRALALAPNGARAPASGAARCITMHIGCINTAV